MSTDAERPAHIRPYDGTVDVAEAGLASVLSVEALDDSTFRGFCHAGRSGRVFGGNVAGQALVAAQRTVPDGLAPHSMHGYFLSAGRASEPITYHVDRSRDGRRYHSRRVEAVQGDRVVFTSSASFAAPTDDPGRQPTMPVVPSPETLASAEEFRDGVPRTAWRSALVDLRFVPTPRSSDPGRLVQEVWLRVADLPDDPALHYAALVYASDFTISWTAIRDKTVPPHISDDEPPFRMASLDHALWFPRPVRADQWLLFEQRSPSFTGERGLSFGNFWTRDGDLLATVAQESMTRRIPAGDGGAVP